MTQHASTKFWVRRDGYLSRGTPGGKSHNGSPVPYEVIKEELYHQPNEQSERYWAMYGMSRAAPIIDYVEE